MSDDRLTPQERSALDTMARMKAEFDAVRPNVETAIRVLKEKAAAYAAAEKAWDASVEEARRVFAEGRGLYQGPRNHDLDCIVRAFR